MDRVPLRLEREGSDPDGLQAFLDVHVGHEPTTLLVDTGSGHTTLPLRIWGERLTTARHGQSVSGSGTRVDALTATLPALRVGSHELRDLEIVLADATRGELAVLGMDVLSTVRCEFRFAVPELLIDAPYDSGYSTHALTTFGPQLPTVDLDVAHTELSAIWDSGASISAIDLAFARTHPALWSPNASPDVSLGHDGLGTTMEFQRGFLAECDIGGVRFARTPCVGVDLSLLSAAVGKPVNLILGLPLLAAVRFVADPGLPVAT